MEIRTFENNKTLARFIGLKINRNDLIYEAPSGFGIKICSRSLRDNRFDLDWNLLMKVYDIASKKDDDFKYSFCNGAVKITINDKEVFFNNKTLIESAYNAIVEFVKSKGNMNVKYYVKSVEDIIRKAIVFNVGETNQELSLKANYDTKAIIIKGIYNYKEGDYLPIGNKPIKVEKQGQLLEFIFPDIYIESVIYPETQEVTYEDIWELKELIANSKNGN